MKEPESKLRALGEKLAREQDAWLARDHDTQHGVLRARPPSTLRALDLSLAAALALAVGIGAWLFLVQRSEPVLEVRVAGKLAAPEVWLAAPEAQALPVSFSDGTRFLLAPRSQGRVVGVTAHGAQLALESGSAEVHVVHRDAGRWQISAGPFMVQVTGTRFQLGWAPREQLLRLALSEGKVLVSGCNLGDARPVLAGETLEASCRARSFEIRRSLPGTSAASVPAAQPSHVVLPAPGTARFDAPAQEPAAARPAPLPSLSPGAERGPVQSRPTHPAAPESSRAAPSWQALARSGKFDAAFALVAAHDVEAEVGQLAPDELLLLGDVGRLTRHTALALRAYARVRSVAPRSAQAVSATFALGTVHFDQHRAYAEAARYFGLCFAEDERGPLAREALGRQVEALSHAHDPSQARDRAALYLRLYPDGPHAALARSLVL